MNEIYEIKYIGTHMYHLENILEKELFDLPRWVYQNKCVNSIYKKPKNNLVSEPVGPVKNGFLFFTSP
jgi:hypothetical protein